MNRDGERLKMPITISDFTEFPAIENTIDLLKEDQFILRVNSCGRITFSRVLGVSAAFGNNDAIKFFYSCKNGLSRWIFQKSTAGLPIHNSTTTKGRKQSEFYVYNKKLAEAIIQTCRVKGDIVFIPIQPKQGAYELLLGSTTRDQAQFIKTI